MVKKLSFLKLSLHIYMGISKVSFILMGLIVLFSCTSQKIEYRFAGQIPPSLIKQYESDVFSTLQKQTVYNMSQRTFLPYRRDFIDIKGRNLLTLAVLTRQLELLPVLIENEVDVNTQDFDGNTALMYAVLFPDSVRAVQRIIDAGADINLQNNEGKTALMYAVEYNITPEYVDILLYEQVNIRTTDDRNQTAWDYLQENPFLPSYGIGTYFSVLPEQQLIDIVKNPRLTNADTLLSSSTDALATYHNNTNLMMWAAKYNPNPSPIIKALSKRIAVDTTDTRGDSVAHYVVNSVHSNRAIKKAIHTLIKLEAPMNLENIDGDTPFLIAIKKNLPFEIIESLIQKTSALSVPLNARKSLIIAAEYNNNTAVHQLLMEYGADVNIQDADGRNLIYYLSLGINKNNEFLLAVYVNAGIDPQTVDKNGNIMFSYTIQTTSNVVMIELLFAQYTVAETLALLLHENRQQQNLLHIAARYNTSVDIINILIKKTSISFLRKQDGFGKIPLIYALEHNSNSDIFKQFIILDPPLLIYRNLSDDMNLVMYATKNIKNPSILGELINFYIGSRKKILDQRDINGNTALHYAVKNAVFIDNVKRLLNIGADVNAQNNLGETPLMLSVRNETSPDITQILMQDRKIDLEIVDNDNRTAFIHAAEKGIFFENIWLLYAAKADANHINKAGKSILQLIKENRFLFIYLDPFE